MLGVFLALAVMIGPEANPAEDSALVARLGSSRYAERESAEAALIARGREALPALRSAAQHRDLEVRVRVAAILRQVEPTLILQATPIRLDFRDAPLGDVLDRINERSDLRLAVASQDDPSWSRRRVTLESPEPLPFWAAIDRIAEAGRLHHLPASAPAPGQRENAFLFQDEDSGPLGFVSDSGPFRSQLVGVSYRSEVLLGRPRPVAAGAALPSGQAEARPNRQMDFQVVVAAEPRLAITQDGPARLLEALDDRGQSLIPAATTRELSHSSGYFGMNSSPTVRVRVELARPDVPGRRIARLKGVVPMIASARKPSPLVVPLDQPAGRVHRNEDVSLVVREVRQARGDEPAVVELSLNASQEQAQQAPDDRPDLIPTRSDIPQQQLEVLDARGNSLAWFPSATQYVGGETRLTLTVPSQGVPAVPATVRYHGIVRASAEVPFEFLDVPMP